MGFFCLIILGMIPTARRGLFTIGHSNHTLAKFLELLAKHGIEVVVDARSHPYSKYVVHFNREDLAAALKSDDSGTRRVVAHALGKIGPGAKVAVAQLEIALTDGPRIACSTSATPKAPTRAGSRPMPPARSV